MIDGLMLLTCDDLCFILHIILSYKFVDNTNYVKAVNMWQNRIRIVAI